MTDGSFGTRITVRATPEQVFAAINDLRAWWSHDVEGDADAVGAEFTFRGKGIHRSLIRVTELVPGRRVAWQVLENSMTFVQDQTEWKDTYIVFELAPAPDGTQIRFEHRGLVPAYECFDTCSDAWSFFVRDSLVALIETGQGKPMEKDRSVTTLA